jgi:hypothetical protein
MQRLRYDGFEVEFVYDGDQNLLIEFVEMGDRRDLIVALRYWGGIPRWTGKVGQVAIQGNQAFVKCDFALARSSDPLGQSKNKDNHALHELIRFVHDGVYTKKSGTIAKPSGSIPFRITSGYDLEKSGFRNEELQWVDF